MVSIDVVTLWVLIACAVVLFVKVVIPACWKFGTVFIRTVFMFLEARENDFPLWPVFKSLPKTLWRVWRTDLNTNYEYTEVCYFNFRNGKFESVLTKDHEWLNTMALQLRRGSKKFTLTFPAEMTGWLINKDELLTLQFHIRNLRFGDGAVPALIISEVKHAGIEGLIGHSLNRLIAVLDYYAPEIFAVLVKSPLGVVSHISTLEATEVCINEAVHQMFIINNGVVPEKQQHLKLVDKNDH